MTEGCLTYIELIKAVALIFFWSQEPKEIEGHQNALRLRYELLGLHAACGDNQNLLVLRVSIETPETVGCCDVGLSNSAKGSDDICAAYYWVILIRVPVLHEASDLVLGIGWFGKVEVLPDDEQGQMNGMMWGSKLVGKAGGAWALSYVINWGGIEACVAVQVALLVLIVAIPLLILERPGERRLPWSEGSVQGDNTSSARNPLTTVTETCRAFSVPTLSVFVFFTLVKLFGTGINEVVVNTLYIKQLGWSDLDFTTASGLYTLPLLLLGTLLGGMLADRFGRRLILTVGYGGFAITAIVFSLCPQFWDQYWFTLTYVLAFETLVAIGSVGFLSLAMRISWSTAAATVFTVYMTLSNVSHVVGNWLAGPVRALTTDYAISTGLAGREAEMFSYQLTIGFAGLITVPALLLLIRVSTSEVDAVAGRQVSDEEDDTSHDELSDAPSGYEDGQMDPIE